MLGLVSSSEREMKSQRSFSISSPESDSQNSTDIKSKEDEMINVAKKILENVNLMSFVNMDFQQVRSMMRIREIARGIVESNVKKVTKNDVDIAMLFAVENMGVEFCRHADGILQRLEYEGMEDGLSPSVSHIKEIISTIVTKRTKLTVSQNDNPIELVDGVDAMTVESKVTLDMDTRNNSIDIWGTHKRLSNEEANMNGKTGNRGDTLGGSFCLGLGNGVQFTQPQGQEGDTVSGSSYLGVEDVQVKVEVGNKEAEACNGLQFTQAEGNQWDAIQGSLCFGVGDAQIKEEHKGEAEAEACNDAQFTEAEENPWDTIDRSLSSGIGHVHVEEENVLVINREAEACNLLQFTQEDGNQGNTIDGSLCLGVGNVQFQEEQHVSVVGGESETCNGVQFAQAGENPRETIDRSLSLEVGNVQVQEEQHVSVVGGEAEACKGLQFKQAEGKQWNSIDGLLCLGIGKVQVQEENISIVNGEAEPCNGIQSTQGEGNLGNTRDGSLSLGAGNVQVREEQRVSLVDGAAEASNDTQAEGMLIENVEMVLGSVLSADQDENALQEETFNARSEPGVTASIPLSTITWPEDGKVTFDWLKNVMSTLDQASKALPPSEFQTVMPITVVDELMNVASHIFSKEPNCVEVDCHKEDSRVVVVGDIHGQYHDLLNLFELAGLPSENQFYVFNGDYVDRGAWGLEVLMVLSAWKVLMPDRVYLLRGNHETKYCTSVYGFEEEVKTKFGDQSDLVYKRCLECFKNLPLASVISNCVFTAHGGLFRSMNVGPLRRSKRKRVEKLKLGSLEDLSKVNRYIIDVADEDPSVLTDVLWSDPSKKNGLIENGDRGLGLFWGPDCTEMFLRQSKLKLIIRSHQGPDARVDQGDFGDMLCGYSMDHAGGSGKLYTLFSAPSYPQFGETKFDNEGAYAVLTPPNFEKPSFHSFKGVERPEPIITGSSTASREDSPAWMSSVVDTEALGISNLPSWSVSLAGGTKIVQVPRAPSAEGLPLPMLSNLQETQRAAFEYLLELVAGLKHMLSSRA